MQNEHDRCLFAYNRFRELFVFVAQDVERMFELEAKRHSSLLKNKRDHAHHIAACQSINFFLQMIQLTLGLLRHRREESIQMITDDARCEQISIRH